MLAVALVVAGTLWGAAEIAYSNTSHRALSDLANTAHVSVEQEDASWSHVLDAVSQAAALPSMAAAVGTGDGTAAGNGLAAMVLGLPIAAGAVYGPSGQLLARTGSPVPPFAEAPAPGPAVRPIVAHGSTVLRDVRVPVLPGSGPAGQLVVSVDMNRLLPGGPAGRFGATGSTSLVARNGMVVAGSDMVPGRPLSSSANLALVSAGRPATAVVYSPHFRRAQVEAYEPIPGQDLGVLAVQAQSEVLSSARQLRTDFLGAAGIVLAAGIAGGAGAGLLAAGRRRRLLGAEAARSDAESRMRVAWETSPLGMTIVRLDGTWQAVNPAAAAMFGAPEPDLVGSSFVEYTHPDDRNIGPPQMAQVAAGQMDARRLEKRYVRPDGTEWWGSVTFSGVPGPDGRPAYVVAEIEDITEARRAAAALEESEARYRTTLDTLEEGVVSYRIGPEGPVVAAANPAARLLLGADLEGTAPVLDRGPFMEMRDEAGRRISADELPVLVAIRTGQAAPRRTFEVVRPDGSGVWLSISARPVLDEAGRVLSVTASFTDITAARRAEAEIEAARIRSAALLEHGADLITISDRDGVITYANPAFLRQLGWPPEQLIGHQITEWIHPDDVERVEAAHAELRGRPGGVVEYECRLRHHDGNWRHMEVVRINHLDDPAIGGIVSTKRDVTERAEAAAQLAHQATHDDLTGLPNRALLLDRLQHALLAAGRGGGRCAVLFLDLDQFKTVNDSLGHAAGDQLLRVVAERIQRAVRPGDTVARLGGDEFVVLAERVGDATIAVEVAERVRASVSRPVDLGRREVSVSCSVGIAVSDKHTAAALLQEADTALYRAKGRGRNRWEMYDQAMRTVARRRLDTETELRRALDDDRFVVAYQPIVSLADASLVGVEALVRMRSPEGRIIAPDSFIEVAEDSGLIVPLGETVLEKACAQAAVWNQRLAERAPRKVAVNLSARQLTSPDLPRLVSAALAAHRLDPAQLCLELTESVLIDAASSTRRTLERVADMGVQLALDDFGTGWSSLAYLRRFPIRILKVDRSFVAGLGVNDDDLEVVKAVIGLGEALSLSLIAEGIETAQQAVLLREMGCHSGQGWFYGRPAGPAEVERYAAAGGHAVDPSGTGPAG